MRNLCDAALMSYEVAALPFQVHANYGSIDFNMNYPIKDTKNGNDSCTYSLSLFLYLYCADRMACQSVCLTNHKPFQSIASYISLFLPNYLKTEKYLSDKICVDGRAEFFSQIDKIEITQIFVK